jgi:hypothetical protein
MAPSNAAKPVPECSGNRPRNIDSFAALDVSIHNETTGNSQGKNSHSPAVAAAIGRDHKRLLAIKRGSLWSLANMACASLDELMESLENFDDEALFTHGRIFIENARGFAKLLGDFRDTGGAGQ